MKRTSKIIPAAAGLLTSLLATYSPVARAGWTGAMNGIGFGMASVNVSEPLGGSRAVTTTNMQSPSVAMTTTPTYVFGGPLPRRASPATEAKVKGFSGYIWQATTVGSDGDSTDNPELEGRVRITAADCAALSMNSSSVIDTNTKNGMITINVHGTRGTAFWTRGFELTNSMYLDPPEDDPATTNKNEFIEFLKEHGDLKWDVLNVGPMNQDTTNCSAINIPFSYDTDITNLYFLSDGVAKSLPLVIQCPSDIVTNCLQTVKYPETVLVGGCGNITVSFDPPAPAGGTFPPGYFPVGTNLVTVTATDKDGNTASCTFNVVVTDTTAPVAPSLPTVTGSCSATVTLTPPTATDNCAGTVTGTTTNSLASYNAAGTNTVYWTFSDGNGNISTATQTVIITGLAFNGFYSPIGGTGGTCASPLRTATQGNNLPVKFDAKCNGLPLTTGQPTMSIKKSNAQCTSLTAAGGGNFTVVGNEWHFNWDTSGLAKATYKLTVTLQDGTQKSVWIKLK